MNWYITLFICIITSYNHDLVQSSWWSLGLPIIYREVFSLKPTAVKTFCQKVNSLKEKQRDICSLSTNTVQTLSKGAKLGIEECQHQFKHNRWNCSTYNHPKVFGAVIDLKSREKAYIYAISAASISYTVIKACSSGILFNCGCGHLIKDTNIKSKWQWGGCSDDVTYGSKFSKEFLDSSENISTAEGLMNLHNNEAGRRILKTSMDSVCKCQGVSGSCTTKVCWRKLSSFRKIGNELSQKFDGATHMSYVQKKHKSRLRPSKRDIKKPSKKDLVYLDESPDFCIVNQSLNVVGTSKRKCNSTSYGMDGCKLLCCGRGYHTVFKKVQEKCDCKFVWCCKVECKKCMTTKEEHFCN